MSLDNIELDLHETPLVATPEGEDPTPEAFAEQVQDKIVNTDLLTDRTGVLVQYEKNDDEVSKTEAVCNCAEAIRITGRINKMAIESITPFISKASAGKIPSSMFTDMPTSINAKRALETIQDEVTQQVSNLSEGIYETTKAALNVLTNEFDKAESDHLNASGKLAQEQAIFLNATHASTWAALDNMGVANANKDTVTSVACVDAFNADVFAEIGTPRRAFNFFIDAGVVGRIIVGDKVFDTSGHPVYSESPELDLSTTAISVSSVLDTLTSSVTNERLGSLKQLFQASMNVLATVSNNAESGSIDELRSLNSRVTEAANTASAVIGTFALHAKIASLACTLVRELTEASGVPSQATESRSFLKLVKKFQA